MDDPTSGPFLTAHPPGSRPALRRPFSDQFAASELPVRKDSGWTILAARAGQNGLMSNPVGDSVIPGAVYGVKRARTIGPRTAKRTAKRLWRSPTKWLTMAIRGARGPPNTMSRGVGAPWYVAGQLASGPDASDSSPFPRANRPAAPTGGAVEVNSKVWTDSKTRWQR